MKISVTQEHIRRGVPRRPWCCPIALALGDVLDDSHQKISVKENEIEIGQIPYVVLITRKTPEICQDFIEAFDNGDVVQPFEFEVDIPEYLTI
jgi:hypothetical protein